MSARCWVIVPAAGSGQRMAAERPKQYLKLGEQTILEHSLAAMQAVPNLAGIVVALALDDAYWPALQLNISYPLFTVVGGAERAASVAAALEALVGQAAEHDWVLVHDAARPCVRQSDLIRLVTSVENDAIGGLLAVPVRDTMKQADPQHRVAKTIDRSQLWHALTPQMFRFAMLRQALTTALERGIAVTDEASAMELSGYHPRLVEGYADNIKITRPEDLALAQFFLKQQGRFA